jgi:hypothetical protein
LPSTYWARVQGSLGYQAMEYGLWSYRNKKKDVTLGIILWLLRRNVLEDTTSRQGTRPCQVGPANLTLGCLACHGEKCPRASRVFLHHLLGCIFTVPQVGLI